MLNQVNWGIIGCGDVTEIKSGPAFSRVRLSRLAAVMRRDAEKARDYARRHNVPKWSADAADILTDPEINAVYIATPPESHARYTFMAAEAGKHIYVEKPMGLNYQECLEMTAAARKAGVKLFTAYYRRALPYFLKIKELIQSGAIGAPKMVEIRLFKPGPQKPVSPQSLPWRFKREIAGGGLFVDLASHQLDCLDFFFGPVKKAKGIALNQAGWYDVEDAVSASFEFESGVAGGGSWCFNVSEHASTDRVEIVGSDGKLCFSSFSFAPIEMDSSHGKNTFLFKRQEPIQEALIQTIVDELTGKGECPSTPESASRTSWVMQEILKDYYSQ